MRSSAIFLLLQVLFFSFYTILADMWESCSTRAINKMTFAELETRWEKDGVELHESSHVFPFESRGVRGLSLRNLREEDSGTYVLRVLGPSTNLYSSCKVTVASRSSLFSYGFGMHSFLLIGRTSTPLTLRRSLNRSGVDYVSPYRMRSRYTRSVW